MRRRPAVVDEPVARSLRRRVRPDWFLRHRGRFLLPSGTDRCCAFAQLTPARCCGGPPSSLWATSMALVTVRGLLALDDPRRAGVVIWLFLFGERADRVEPRVPLRRSRAIHAAVWSRVLDVPRSGPRDRAAASEKPARSRTARCLISAGGSRQLGGERRRRAVPVSASRSRTGARRVRGGGEDVLGQTATVARV